MGTRKDIHGQVLVYVPDSISVVHIFMMILNVRIQGCPIAKKLVFMVGAATHSNFCPQLHARRGLLKVQLELRAAPWASKGHTEHNYSKCLPN